MPSLLLRLFVGISVVLVLSVLSTQANDTLRFQAMSLVRFAEAVHLPPISLPDLTGKEVPLQSLRGKVILLNFWTTW
jgi:cytochrome oxidase Cu insertion factor (SCO1/SenC/PrrC family)